jgi:DNA-binding transcriptional LysR family regulator
VRLADLAEENWIASPVTNQKPELISSHHLPLQRAPTVSFDGDDFKVIMNLVEQGLGVALLPRISTLHSPENLVIRPLEDGTLIRHIYVSKLRSQQRSKTLEHFEQHLINHFQGRSFTG